MASEVAAFLPRTTNSIMWLSDSNWRLITTHRAVRAYPEQVAARLDALDYRNTQENYALYRSAFNAARRSDVIEEQVEVAALMLWIKTSVEQPRREWR
jgi:site-specific DNA-adenine methylase